MNNNSTKLQPYLMHPSKGYSNFSQQYNPQGNFLPVTHNNPNNFNEAFAENNPIIQKHDYRNKQNILHNNLADSLINEHVTEYRLNIDSKDRDMDAYPNPFHFTVAFDAPSNSSIKEKVFIDPKDPSKGKMYVDIPIGKISGPHINRKFKNIKYIKIETMILPRFHRVVFDGAQYKLDASDTLDDDRFLILEIPELKNISTYGTNTAIEGGYVILPDRITTVYFTCITYYANKVFDDNSLGNIDKLTFILKNSFGEEYVTKIYDTNGNVIADKLENDIDGSNNINNVHNKIHQAHITIQIGIVENQLNTLTKYEQ